MMILGISTISCNRDDDDTSESVRPVFSLQQPDEFPEDTYDIYSLVIEEEYSSDKIVIRQETMGSSEVGFESQSEYLTETYPDFDSTLFETHRELNTNSQYFGQQFYSDSKEIILISTEELSYIFNSQDVEANWEEFYTEYPNSNGSILFSRIAYNDDQTQAIFEISHSYASMGGSGSLVYLKKQDGNWIIADILITWIS